MWFWTVTSMLLVANRGIKVVYVTAAHKNKRYSDILVWSASQDPQKCRETFSPDVMLSFTCLLKLRCWSFQTPKYFIRLAHWMGYPLQEEGLTYKSRLTHKADHFTFACATLSASSKRFPVGIASLCLPAEQRNL